MPTIGEQIIAARKAKGMTQDALAKALNKSRAGVSHWETNRTMPDAETLLRLSQVLEYSFEDSAAKPAPDPVPAPAPRRWRVAAIVAAAVVLACAALFAVPALRRTQASRPKYPAEYFDQLAPNDPAHAYLALSADNAVQSGSERDYQMYTFRLTEQNGIPFAIDSIEVCGYGPRFNAETYTAADMRAGSLVPELDAYGTFDFTGGFPLGSFDRIGVIVRGKDATGAPLSFTGSTTF